VDIQNQYIVFDIDRRYYALSLLAVVKIIRAVELIHLPDASDILQGLINIRGEIIPVINIRKLFFLPDRRIELSDSIIIAQTSTREIGFVVDKIEGVVKIAQVEKGQNIFSDFAAFTEGVGRFNNTTVLIFDIDKLFSIHNTKHNIQGNYSVPSAPPLSCGRSGGGEIKKVHSVDLQTKNR